MISERESKKIVYGLLMSSAFTIATFGFIVLAIWIMKSPDVELAFAWDKTADVNGFLLVLGGVVGLWYGYKSNIQFTE